MKKPRKTLKDYSRLEGLLTKQTARSAKLLAKRKTGDAANPATDRFYERIAERHAASLEDLSELARLGEALSLQIAEAEQAKAVRKPATAKKVGSGQKASSGAKSAATPARKAPLKTAAKPVRKTASTPAAKRTRRAPSKTAAT